VSNTTLKDDKPRVKFPIFIENIRNILNTTRQVFSVLRIPPSSINFEKNPRIAYFTHSFAKLRYNLIPYLNFMLLQSSAIAISEVADNN
jgi:hypothetical protein